MSLSENLFICLCRKACFNVRVEACFHLRIEKFIFTCVLRSLFTCPFLRATSTKSYLFQKFRQKVLSRSKILTPKVFSRRKFRHRKLIPFRTVDIPNPIWFRSLGIINPDSLKNLRTKSYLVQNFRHPKF